MEIMEMSIDCSFEGNPYRAPYLFLTRLRTTPETPLQLVEVFINTGSRIVCMQAISRTMNSTSNNSGPTLANQLVSLQHLNRMDKPGKIQFPRPLEAAESYQSTG